MKTCENCRYSKVENVPDAPYYMMYCKLHYNVDYISGQRTYTECHDIREHNKPNCKNWEQGGIKGFFQRLLTKVKKN